MASSRHSHSTHKSAAKSLKRVTAGGLEGVWDTKRRCVSLELPVGVTFIQMVVEGVDGVHTMDFSSFECAGSSSSGRTMITPGRHPTSCWPEKPGITDVAPL